MARSGCTSSGPPPSACRARSCTTSPGTNDGHGPTGPVARRAPLFGGWCASTWRRESTSIAGNVVFAAGFVWGLGLPVVLRQRPRGLGDGRRELPPPRPPGVPCPRDTTGDRRRRARRRAPVVRDATLLVGPGRPRVPMGATLLGLRGWAWARPRQPRPSWTAGTVAAWNRYVSVTEARISRELASAPGFLVLDFPASGRGRRRAGADPRARWWSPMSCLQQRRANPIEVSGGTIHHWRAAVFIAGVTVDQLLSRVRNPNVSEHRQEDVLESRVLGRDAGGLRLLPEARAEEDRHRRVQHTARRPLHASLAVARLEPQCRHADRRGRGRGHARRTREATRAGPRLPLEAQLLLALRGRAWRRSSSSSSRSR